MRIPGAIGPLPYRMAAHLHVGPRAESALESQNRQTRRRWVCPNWNGSDRIPLEAHQLAPSGNASTYSASPSPKVIPSTPHSRTRLSRYLARSSSPDPAGSMCAGIRFWCTRLQLDYRNGRPRCLDFSARGPGPLFQAASPFMMFPLKVTVRESSGSTSATFYLLRDASPLVEGFVAELQTTVRRIALSFFVSRLPKAIRVSGKPVPHLERYSRLHLPPHFVRSSIVSRQIMSKVSPYLSRVLCFGMRDPSSTFTTVRGVRLSGLIVAKPSISRCPTQQGFDWS